MMHKKKFAMIAKHITDLHIDILTIKQILIEKKIITEKEFDEKNELNKKITDFVLFGEMPDKK